MASLLVQRVSVSVVLDVPPQSDVARDPVTESCTVAVEFKLAQIPVGRVSAVKPLLAPDPTWKSTLPDGQFAGPTDPPPPVVVA